MRSYKSCNIFIDILNKGSIWNWLIIHILIYLRYYFWGNILLFLNLWSYNNFNFGWFLFIFFNFFWWRCKFVAKWCMSIFFRATCIIFAFFFSFFNFAVLASIKPFLAVWCFYLGLRGFPKLACPLWYFFKGFLILIFTISEIIGFNCTCLPAIKVFHTIWVYFSCFELMSNRIIFHFISSFFSFIFSYFFFSFTPTLTLMYIILFLTLTFTLTLAFTFFRFRLLVFGSTSINWMSIWQYWNSRNSCYF